LETPLQADQQSVDDVIPEPSTCSLVILGALSRAFNPAKRGVDPISKDALTSENMTATSNTKSERNRL
jgi:hypothetical protein